MTIHTSVGRIRCVLVKAPLAESMAAWRDFGWHAAPDPVRAADEHAAFRLELAALGAEVVLAQSQMPGNPDSIYVYDPTLPTDLGLIALRPGKAARRSEPPALASDLQAAGLQLLGSLTPPATAEGGDMFWLDERTLLVGRSYRTNDAGVEQIRSLLGPRADVVAFDLAHHLGPEACLHLMSFISPLDRDLAIVYLPMVPVRLVEILREREVKMVEVPDEELATQGPNVLALAPRVALVLQGSPVSRRRMEAAGVEVRTYAGHEISLKGDGGPTCLTRPLRRDPW